MLLEFLKADARATLTEGRIEDAEDNLRNYRAVAMLENSIKVLTNE